MSARNNQTLTDLRNHLNARMRPSLRRFAASAAGKRPSFRPRLEALEERCLLAQVLFGGDILKETFDDLPNSSISYTSSGRGSLIAQLDDPGTIVQVDPATGNSTSQQVGTVFHHEFSDTIPFLESGGTTDPLVGQTAQKLFLDGDTITIEPYYPSGSVPGSADVNQVAIDVARNYSPVTVTFNGRNGSEELHGTPITDHSPNQVVTGTSSGPSSSPQGTAVSVSVDYAKPGGWDTLVATEQDVIGTDSAGKPITLGSIQQIVISGFEQEIDNIRALVFFPNIHLPPKASDTTYTFHHGQTGPYSVNAANGLIEDGYGPNGVGVVTAKLLTGPGFDPAHGQITAFNPQNGSFTYTPTTSDDRIYSDKFAFLLNDGTFDSNIAYAILQPDSNQRPIVHSERFDNLPHDQIGHPFVLGTLLDLASDPDGDPVHIDHIDGPSAGTLQANANGVYTYYPDANTIEDSFHVTFSDGYDTSVAALVHLSWIDHAPMATDAVFDVNFVAATDSPHFSQPGFFNPLYVSDPSRFPSGESVSSLVTDEDVGDASRLSYMLVSQPRYGQLNFDPQTGDFTYLPDGPKYYTDSFTYYATDGFQSSNLGYVQLVPKLWLVPHSDAYSTNLTGRHQVGLLANDSFPSGADIFHYVDIVRLAQDLSVDFYWRRYNLFVSGSVIGSDGQPVSVGGVISTDGTFSLQYTATEILNPSPTSYSQPLDSVDSFAYKVRYAQNDDFNPPFAETDPIGVLVHVTTTAESNVTGVGDGVELSNPAGLDTNGDGIPDYLQDNVATLPIGAGPNQGQYMTIAAPDGVKLVGVQSLANPPAPVPDGVDFPFGFLAFDVTGLEAGGSVAVTLTLPADVPQGFVYYKYDYVADNPGWYPFTYDPATNIGAQTHWDDPSIPTNQIVLHLQDDERGDLRNGPTAKFANANGIIVDPGGIGPPGLVFPRSVGTTFHSGSVGGSASGPLGDSMVTLSVTLAQDAPGTGGVSLPKQLSETTGGEVQPSGAASNGALTVALNQFPSIFGLTMGPESAPKSSSDTLAVESADTLHSAAMTALVPSQDGTAAGRVPFVDGGGDDDMEFLPAGNEHWDWPSSFLPPSIDVPQMRDGEAQHDVVPQPTDIPVALTGEAAQLASLSAQWRPSDDVGFNFLERIGSIPGEAPASPDRAPSVVLAAEQAEEPGAGSVAAFLAGWGVLQSLITGFRRCRARLVPATRSVVVETGRE
jgi:hypothetical protein